MTSKNWHPLVRGLHWLTVPVMAACVGAMWLHEAFDKADPVRAQLVQTHFLLGLVLGLLAIFRLTARAFTQPPEHSMAPKHASLIKLAHLGLYGVLLALPVLGYIAVSGRGTPIEMLGVLSLPPMSVAKDTAHLAKELHEGLANSLLGLLTIHVGMAVYHTVVLKDKVLASMRGTADR